jgi:hypothetical protein
VTGTLAIPRALELQRHFDWGASEFWVYETPRGEFVMVVYNETADGYVAHRTNRIGSWLGPQIIGGHGNGRGRVLDLLEHHLLDRGEL